MLPLPIAETLRDVLGEHTVTPEECFFALWEGFGGLPVEEFGAAFTLPARRYYLFTAGLSAATATIDRHTPNMWWPADRAWCVATEIDLRSTYVGCTDAAARALLDTGLETDVVRPDDRGQG